MNTKKTAQSRNAKSSTIAAIATPLGEGGVGVIRVSGPKSLQILLKIFSSRNNLKPSTVYHGYIRDPRSKIELDEVMAFYQKGPNSYTGEDIVEISGHGGIITLQNILQLLLRQGVQLAAPGEFTRRAFMNQRIDLTQAEAVCDIIRARTALGSRIAFGQLKGKLSGKLKQLREQLLDSLVQLEASLDFPDDIAINNANISKALIKTKNDIDHILATAEKGKLIRHGLNAAIVGRTNVGKSSLLNCLLEEERAIVSPLPGTTRDFIEDIVNIFGIPIRIVDTAGIREPLDCVEATGIERTKQRLGEAELVLFMLDASEPLRDDDKLVAKLVRDKPALLVENKCDLKRRIGTKDITALALNIPRVRISATNGDGVEALKKAVYDYIGYKKVIPSEEIIITNIRHQEALLKAQTGLIRGIASLDTGKGPEVVAIDLRDAIIALGEVTGDTVSEEIVNRIFSSFCVGK